MARKSICLGQAFKFCKSMLRYHFPNLPAHLYEDNVKEKDTAVYNSATLPNSELKVESAQRDVMSSQDPVPSKDHSNLVAEPRIPFE